MKLIACAALIIIFNFSASGQSNNYKNEFGFQSDNDAYLATYQDRYYTNGLFVFFRHALNDKKPTDNLIKKTWEIELGQKMYNPQSGHITNIEYVDRPFAAYLYTGGRFNWFHKNEQVLQTSFQIGLIGSSALGEQVQKTLHQLVGFYPIEGWQYQINNELEANSAITYSRLLGRSENNKADISLNSYANLGTTFSGAGVGALIRLGKLNSFFKSVSTNSRITASKTDTVNAEFFLFAKPMVQMVAYDASISGGLFRKNKGPKTFNSKPLVLSQEIGIMYAKKRFTLDFALTYKTKEVESIAKPHQWGSISMYYRFN